MLARVRDAIDEVTLLKKAVAQGSVSNPSTSMGMVGISHKGEVPRASMFKDDRSAKEIDNFRWSLNSTLGHWGLWMMLQGLTMRPCSWPILPWFGGGEDMLILRRDSTALPCGMILRS